MWSWWDDVGGVWLDLPSAIIGLRWFEAQPETKNRADPQEGECIFPSFLEQVGLIALLLLPFLPWRWYQGKVMSHQNAHLCQFGRPPILKWYWMGPFWLSSLCYIFCCSLQIHLQRRTIDWALLGSLVLPISFTKPPRALMAQKWNFCPQLDLWAPDYFLLYSQVFTNTIPKYCIRKPGTE